MNKFLSMLENPRPETVVEEENLKNLKISIWDYFNISESTYKSYSVDEKSRLFINIILNFILKSLANFIKSIMSQVTFIFCFCLGFC